MKHIDIRFYEELNDFLPVNRRKKLFGFSFSGNQSVKEIIGMLGVPHSEVDLILVNGEAVGFDFRPHDQDRISVYPVFESIDIAPMNRLRPIPLRKIKFILDVHLGRLAKYLRICGFDCYYKNLDDLDIILQSLKENRIILTKDKGLLKNKNVTHGYWVRGQQPRAQLLEVITRFDLFKRIKFLTRCLLCNNKLDKVPKDQVTHLIPTKTGTFYEDFYICGHCSKVYWQGSHYENMNELIKYLEDALKNVRQRKPPVK